MDADQKKVFHAIAQCAIADEILNHLLDPKSGNDGLTEEARACRDICSYQQDEISKITEKYGSEYQVEFSKETFHMPEPWNGNLGEAEILFVSSNPSFDILETTEELAKIKNGKQGQAAEILPKFDSEDWPDERVEDFFENRFDHKGYRNQTWSKTLRYAAYLLDLIDELNKTGEINVTGQIGGKLDEKQKAAIASRIALTEVVHCKSQKERGVKSSANTCYSRHTKKVIELFLKSPSKERKIVVFAGQAKNIVAIENPEFENLEIWEQEEELENWAQKEFSDLGGKALFVMMPHAVARKVTYESVKKKIDRQISRQLKRGMVM
ncbi:hypothetical protein [Corynebacterium ureicelerivorans]|uniref:hypothetical protein n=1 Tax=Corynebacterium ureicelerivorans TaxID=401472 RepID=UPI0023549A82|nr:hypothetical protein [Corynebacterium ureicelerivorans]